MPLFTELEGESDHVQRSTLTIVRESETLILCQTSELHGQAVRQPN